MPGLSRVITTSAPPMLEAPPTIGAQCLNARWDEKRQRVVKCGRCAQELFLNTKADILIGGGSAGGGKTYGLLMEPLRHVETVPGFGANIFRRIMPSVTNIGGMWSQSYELYPHVRGRPVTSPHHKWTFPPYSTTVVFAHLQHEDDKLSYAGAQVPLLEFDQLEEFEQGQFWYIWSRARTGCKVAPYVRGTANPIPEDDATGGWVHQLLQWWIDPETGLAIPERSGQVRWILRLDNDQIEHYATKQDAALKHPAALPAQSLCFVRMALQDNPILREKDPTYEGKLALLPRVERERLLGGNWNSRPAAGKVFNRAWFKSLKVAPVGGLTLRYWDKAATEEAGNNDPDASAGVKMKKMPDGRVIVLHAITGKWTPEGRNRVIYQTAVADGRHVPIVIEQEPGSGGKESAQISVRELSGWDVRADKVTGEAVSRMGPFSAQCEAGNVYLIEGDWNEAYLAEHHAVPDGRHDDQATASAGCFNRLSLLQSHGGTVPLSGH